MLYKARRRLYSQNFLRNPKLINKLVGTSSIGKKDTVVEIGPGTGNITSQLIKTAGKVIAIEIDKKLILFLKKRFKSANNLELVQGDFLKQRLPNYPYKIFANLPFNITSAVIRKLTKDENLLDGYLIIQKEAAKRFIGKPYDTKNSMISLLLKPWYEISVHSRLKGVDFIPKPSVDILMIRIQKLTHSKVDKNNAELYRDYVIYNFSRSNMANLDFERVLDKFETFIRYASKEEKKKVSLKAKKYFYHQKKFHSIK